MRTCILLIPLAVIFFTGCFKNDLNDKKQSPWDLFWARYKTCEYTDERTMIKKATKKQKGALQALALSGTAVTNQMKAQEFPETKMEYFSYFLGGAGSDFDPNLMNHSNLIWANNIEEMKKIRDYNEADHQGDASFTPKSVITDFQFSYDLKKNDLFSKAKEQLVVNYFADLWIHKVHKTLTALYILDEPDMQWAKYPGLTIEALTDMINRIGMFIKAAHNSQNLNPEIIKRMVAIIFEKAALDPKIKIPATQEELVKEIEADFKAPKLTIIYSSSGVIHDLPKVLDWVGVYHYGHMDISNPLDTRSPSIDDILCSLLWRLYPHQRIFIVPQTFIANTAMNPYFGTDELAFLNELPARNNSLANGLNLGEFGRVSLETLNKKILPRIFGDNFETRRIETSYLPPYYVDKLQPVVEGIMIRRLNRWMCYTNPSSRTMPCEEDSALNNKVVNKLKKILPPNSIDENVFPLPSLNGKKVRNKYGIRYPIIGVMPFLWKWPDNVPPADIIANAQHTQQVPVAENMKYLQTELRKWGQKILGTQNHPQQKAPLIPEDWFDDRFQEAFGLPKK